MTGRGDHSDGREVSIRGVSLPRLLVALFEWSQQYKWGNLYEQCGDRMTEAQAKEEIDRWTARNPRCIFVDQYKGVQFRIKLDLRKCTFRTSEYNACNGGDDVAERIIASLRQEEGPTPP